MHTRTALSVFTATTLAMFWVGCQSSVHNSLGGKDNVSAVVNGTTPAAAPTATPAAGTTGLDTVKPVIATIPSQIDIQPANGTKLDGQSTAAASVHFTGFTTAPNEKVDIQVLTDPNAAPAETNWTTIATATADATATNFNDTANPIYRYAIDATPGDHWPEGGVLRFRTVATDAAGAKSLLPFFDLASGDCIAAQGPKGWKDLLAACKSPFSPDLGAALGSTTKAAALVSPTPAPGDGFRPNYLSRKGFIDATQTTSYYNAVNAPQTLTDFRRRFGFDTQAEVDAVYYNLGDLGIGREMHCTTFDRNGQNGTACYVRNYGDRGDGIGDFSGNADRAMRDAVAQRGSFAAVCMVKFGNTFADPQGNDVQFFVYDANENIANRAQLDSVDSNDAIPNNCTNCHGGNYDDRTQVLTGSTFLPFDPESFLFAKDKGFSFAEQEDQFRQLNVMMKNAGSPPGTAQLVDGFYGGKSDVAGTHTNLDWIPAGWNGSEEAKTVYREVYKPYCRTCHTSQVGEFAFMTYDDFKTEAAKTSNSVCTINEMPVAEATMKNFWASSARGFLVNSVDANNSCTANNAR
jgi:hypothetical protein